MGLRGLKLRKRRKNDQKWPKMTIFTGFQDPLPPEICFDSSELLWNIQNTFFMHQMAKSGTNRHIRVTFAAEKDTFFMKNIVFGCFAPPAEGRK